jgi:hypothetical protein
MSTTMLPAAEMSADEWTRRATAMQVALNEWFADDKEAIDLNPILEEGAYLYGLTYRVSELCMELISAPMSAPTYHHAAMIILTGMAVDESGILMDGPYLVKRNICWARHDRFFGERASHER